jgi:hypothetical protein
MGDFFLTLWNYLGKAILTTSTQLFVLFFPLLLLAFLMNYISLLNEDLSVKVMGRNIYLYLFGWLGTSVHELGHALFAVIFGHKIKEIKLFKPDPKSGTLGYVNHSYNEKNLYHLTGNFFIGIGPLLMCTLLLYLLSLLLFRINFFAISNIHFSTDTLKSFSLLKHEGSNIWNVLTVFFKEVFHGKNSSWWKIAILIYCLYCIGSSITLSPSDIKTSVKGFLIIVVLFFVFNLATNWIGGFALDWLSKINPFLSGIYSIMILAMVVNLVFVVIISIILMVKYLLRE